MRGSCSPLILASHSPRRRDLLAQARINFETVSPAVEEREDTDLTLRELTAWNALRKGLRVARMHPRHVVLSADTLVALRGRIMGKPENLDDAVRILLELSGKVHEVCSAVFIGHLARARVLVFQETSEVRFKSWNKAEIRKYAARVGSLDKAGAYAAQGGGAEIIESVEGSLSNVVGLPLERTLPALARFGIRPVAV